MGYEPAFVALLAPLARGRFPGAITVTRSCMGTDRTIRAAAQVADRVTRCAERLWGFDCSQPV